MREKRESILYRTTMTRENDACTKMHTLSAKRKREENMKRRVADLLAEMLIMTKDNKFQARLV